MQNPQGLVRGLGLLAAMSINIANIIGTGVFLKARVMTCNVDTPAAVLGAWLAAALLVTAGALTYAELGAMMPAAGGEYVFLRETYGRRFAFLYGWTYFFLARGGALAAQAVASAIFLNIVTGGALNAVRFEAGPVKLGGLQAVSTLALVLTALLNCAAVQSTGRIAIALTIFKTVAVAAVGVAGFLAVRGDWANYGLINSGGACEGVAAGARGGWAGFGAAMLGALWGFHGWANLAPLVGEVRDPQRNIPRAFLGAIVVVAALYLFANASYFYVLTPTEIASVSLDSSVAMEVIRNYLGPMAAGLMAGVMMISSLGAIHAGMASGARVPFAMARDGLFPEILGKVSGAHVPVCSVLLTAGWSVVLALSGSYDKLTDSAMFAHWMFFGLAAVALVLLRRRDPGAPRPYRVPGYPVVPGLFALITLGVLASTVYSAPWQSLAGLALMLVSLPVYWILERRSERSQ